MTELHLDYLLQTVGERYRRYGTWRHLAVFWVTVAVVGVAVWGISIVSGISSAYTMPLYLVAALFAGFMTYLASRSRKNDVRWLARRIEEEHPELKSLLLTAVEQRQSLPGSLGYLQQRVIQQALEHARHHDWRSVISDAKIHRAQFAHAAALITMLVVTIGLWSINPRTAQAVIFENLGASTPQTDIAFEIQVDPGHVEVERGTGLVVTARFGERMPVDVALHATAPNSPPETMPMQKSLDDPLFGTRIPIVDADLTYVVEYDGRRTEEYRVTVFEYPQLLQADARVEFPSYAGREPLVAEDVRQVTAVEGSTATLTFTLNKSVAEALLVAEGIERVPLRAIGDDPHRYEVTLPMRESRNFTLQLTDAQGRHNKRPPLFSLNVLPNRPPDITLTFPGRDQQVSPLEEMLVTGTVSDDFGVTAHGMAFAIGDEPQQVLTFENQAGDLQQVSQQIHFEELDAQPDQLLSYYLWADDYDGEGQLRRTESDVYFAEVRHFDEIFRQGQTPPGGGGGAAGGGGQGEQLQDLIKLQKEIVTATWKLRRGAAEAAETVFNEQLEVIAQSQAQALEQLTEVLEKLTDSESRQAATAAQSHMATAVERLGIVSAADADESLLKAYAAERAAYQALLKLRAREHEVTKGQQGGGGGGGGGGGRSQQQLQQLELTDKENRYQNESTAQSQVSDAQRETNQLLNRLRELAQRQSDLNERIKELQSALQAAQDEAERRELERRLKRLREDQREILRDADELRDRMQQSPRQADTQQAQQQVNQTRENMHRASEALEQGQLSQALNSGTRAERELQQLRDEFREKSAGAFADEMQNMREDARGLAEQQQQIAEQMEALEEGGEKSLRDVREKDRLAEKLQEQQEKLDDVLKQVREVSQAAETGEPLLSKQLYDTLRDTEQKQPQQALDAARQLMQRGWSEQASRAERQARDSIEQLKSDVERAAESVLGNETEALKRARQELADLAQQLNQEIAQGDPNSQQQPGQGQSATEGENGPGRQPGGSPGQQEPRQPPDQQQDQSRQQGQQQGRDQEQNRSAEEGQQEQGRQAQQGQGQQGQSEQQQQDQGQQPGRGQQPGQGQQPAGGQPDESRDAPGDAAAGGRNSRNSRRTLRDQAPRPTERNPSPGSPQSGNETTGGGGPGGPITGGDFRAWSDRLRDVEEMVEDPDLREQVATIRDRARSIRAEFRRHSKEPNWSLVDSMVAQPLVELQNRLREEIAKRESPDALVPIDRDPVPAQYRELVRRYYQRVGSGK